MAAKPKGPPVCKAFIKDVTTLSLKVCNSIIEDSRCPNKTSHMMAYKTGFCANGDCEGTAKKTKAGQPHMTCKFWLTCPCDCHKTYDQMFKMSEMERILVDVSGYSPNHGEFSMPTLEERIALTRSFIPDHDNVPTVLESVAPDTVPGTIVRSFIPTTSGRAARGELESWVKSACDTWLIEGLTEKQPPCTPPYLAYEIAKEQGIGEPSVGAIDAVLKRWVVLDFAIIAAKPTRFTGYTASGVTLGLDGCKDRVKRSKKVSQQASAKGSLR